MKTGVLFAYFAKKEEGRQAFRMLQRRGFSRSAWLSRDLDGHITAGDPFLLRWIIGTIGLILLGGLIATAVFMCAWPLLTQSGMSWVMLPCAAGAVAGGIISLLIIRRGRYGIEWKLLETKAHWLLSGETMLVIQAAVEDLKTSVTLLQESGDVPPAVFILHPQRESHFQSEWGGENPLTTAQLHEHVQHLAVEHRLDDRPVRNTLLLNRLEQGRQWVQQICLDLSIANHLEQRLPPIAEWLLDNEYLFESNARDIRLNLPWRFYRKLPILASEPHRGLPRIYAMARELAAHTYLRLDEENILAFVDSYQTVNTLSISELWAFPQMLRTVLIESIQQLAGHALTELREREMADLWANRLITTNRRAPNHLFSLLAELAATQPQPSPYFAAQLFDFLYDEEAVRTPVQGWLERVLNKSMNELVTSEKTSQTRDQISIGNAFTSLRQLALLDWKECFERICRVEQILRLDPAGIYPRMDFATRDRYRRAIEDLHRGSGQAEEWIAQRVVELSDKSAGDDPRDVRTRHVGTYLIDEKRGELACLLGSKERWRFRILNWAYRHSTEVYFGGICTIFSALVAVIVFLSPSVLAPVVLLVFLLLLLLPVSQLAIDATNYLLIRLFPPRSLAKMDYHHSGIPDNFRTLVVVPMLLTNEETIRNEADKLEIRYLANKEENLLFSLYSDYTDAPQQNCAEDEHLLATAKECLHTLNERYGGQRFFLLHRERKWCEAERIFMGWERKRGKLEELNGLIVGIRPQEADQLVIVGDANRLADVRFVITLDSDTQLPHDTARRMIETLAHPLNQPRFDAQGQVLRGSYTIIQPRVSASLPSSNGSAFSRLFSDPVGVDPYTSAISDVYQDLTGEGSYHGKGIYDVRAFSRILSGRFPENRLLSHDLIEGAHVRVGLASDIELYDSFPQNYTGYLQRQHRWIRGDWQIASWIMPLVPLADNRLGRNPLSLLNRWKILDNLRRSLLPVASLALLLAAGLTPYGLGWLATIVVAMQLFFHSLAQPVTWMTSGRILKNICPGRIAHDLLLVLAEAALMPCQAYLAVDAVARVFYRRHISHRKMLEWATAQASRSEALPLFFYVCMGAISLLSILAGWALLCFQPERFPAASPWLALWALALPIALLLTRLPRLTQFQYELSQEDRRFMRSIARRTWRYFVDFVNEKTSWLPPDNYQVSHQHQLAMRTSPTNIGLYMTSVLSAHDFGYLTADEVAMTLTRTMDAVTRLERYEGHLFNWYDIQTLVPLHPRYVSTVDSGNLLGSLWAIDQGLEALLRAPLVCDSLFMGLCDTAHLLHHAIREEKGGNTHEVDDFLRVFELPPTKAFEAILLLQKTERQVAQFAAVIDVGKNPGAGYWTGEIKNQLAAWNATAERYLSWLDILAQIPEEDFAAMAPEAMADFRQVITHAPCLAELAAGNVPCIAALANLRERPTKNVLPHLVWIERVLSAFDLSQRNAGETLMFFAKLSAACRALSESINMLFLYNEDRRLFSIGYNVTEGRLDRSFYDLLASEVRLGSFVTIARGDIPAQHWFALSRPYGTIGRCRALLSWTGTMFEYLMPLLFQRNYSNTLLDKAAKDAVDIQIAYGRKHQIPWGISECAFADLDHNKTYQYYAFGVPELGLKRGIEEKIVVSPYSSLLAVSIAPHEAVQNLKRLADLHLLSDYGYYEALDFSRQPKRGGERGVIVRAYMTHHQGMSFLALTNFLHGECLRNRFHADPRVKAFEQLLYERIPHQPPLHHVATRERMSTVSAIGENLPSAGRFETPDTNTPKTQLLSNGQFHLMLTNAGGGYSRWGDVAITRWRADSTADCWGEFCYIQDADSLQLWCNTYQPTAGKVGEYGVSFTLDRAVYRRLDYEIECETEVIVAPEDDVEIRRLSLTNRSDRTRHLDLTSYQELVLAPHNADLKHPAFNKLFIQTETLPDQQSLLAWRRPRSADDIPVFAAHRFTIEQAGQKPADTPLCFETDRRRFIGRGHTMANPMGATQTLGNSQGYVLDPIFSLRNRVTLDPGQRVLCSLVLAAGSSREQMVVLMNKYADPHAIARALDFAWVSAQLELRLLRIQPDDARRFQQLASFLLYPNSLLRANAKSIAENRKGQAGLWAYSISGDLPIVLIAINEARDLGLIRQILQAHSYWRIHGLKVDLVILNEGGGGYTQPLRKEIEHLIQSYASNTEVARPGGVYLHAADLIPAGDLTLLRAAASVFLVAARGTLSQQLGAAQELFIPPSPLVKKKRTRDISSALPFMELHFFNSLGGFTQDGREYAIYLAPGLNTPAPWVNVIANPTFGTLISETGSGFTWQGNSQRNRLTQWANDPVMDVPAEVIYLRDEESGCYWSPTAAPIREATPYRAKHGMGYSIFEHNSHGIEQELTVFVVMNEMGGEPVKLQRLTLRNDTIRMRTLSVTYYVEWTLGETRESSQMHITTAWDADIQALIARNRYNPDYPDQLSFASLSPASSSYTADRTIFLGRNRTVRNPAAMERSKLSRRTGAGLDPCAALQVSFTLLPGERKEVTCLLGQSATYEQMQTLVLAYRDRETVEAALRQAQAWWDSQLNAIQVRTPEPSADLLINRWLLYQTLSCRLWARSGFYQSGGAFGFRDQLQDIMALLYAQPQLAREHILLAASRQFKEGDVQHWWHPPSGAGIRSRVSDDLLWLPFVTAQYVRVTGDTGIMQEVIPFLEASTLNADQHECFQVPGEANERATLFEHCQRALERGQNLSVRGLPKMGTGDWNDGMNLVGAGGQGESVWLAWFIIEVLQGMTELAGLLQRPELCRNYQANRDALIKHVEAFAWDGDWYQRATYDDGTPLGSSANTEARIDSLPQSWAVLSAAADPARSLKALDSAWEHLVRKDEGLALLFEPPFERAQPSPGYIKGYPPGVRENGGQYTHAAIWLAMATARSGDGTRAAELLRMLNPIEHARDPEAVWRYGIEPYVVAADVYRLPERIGQGGWSWYTGSAAWMYRAWIEELLGLTVRGDTLRITPVIPKLWDGFQISYRHGEAMYEIQVENPEHCAQGVTLVRLDGQTIADGIIPLSREAAKHQILVRMGSAGCVNLPAPTVL